jgi:class 3 adenylate cyclase
MRAPHSLEGWRQSGEQLLKDGSPLVAYDTLAQGLAEFPSDTRLRQLTALALARSGASLRANEMLSALVAEKRRGGETDEETLSLLARTHKDLAAEADTEAARQAHLQRAFELYREAAAGSGGYYSAINAATMALLTGRRADVRELAGAVERQCLSLLEADPARGDLYWVLATLGEAMLLLNDHPAAEAWYRKAAAASGGRLGDLVSTRRNARLIAHHLGADTGPIDRVLGVPSVLVFVGHLIDRPGRAVPRFPPEREDAVREAIEAYLRKAPCGVGFAAAACGADILFLEALHAMGAESRIVLPYDREQFREDSVDIVPGADWNRRYDAVLAHAKEVVVASEQRMVRGGVSYEYGFMMLDGAAGVRADELDTELRCVAVWDGQEGDGPGGTAASVERWRASGRTPDIIDLRELTSSLPGRSSVGPSSVGPSSEGPSSVGPSYVGRDFSPASKVGQDFSLAKSAHTFTPQIVGMLFADARGFSKLTEEEIPLFVNHFLGAVRDELARAPVPPVFSNTWGDGLYFVFSGVAETGAFALNLRDAIREIDWKARGFRNDIALRIGLHVGPVYQCIDPVTARTNFIGAHVSHAARIEPVTPPGEVYASQAFAALARAERVRQFTCAYVGQTPLAKGYGTFPTYVVHRRRV